MDFDKALKEWGGLTESYSFYNGEIELRFDPEEHIYLLVKGSELIPQDGVTTVCHIIDKSTVLINWACKMMAEKLIASVHFPIEEMELTKLILAAKSAHREKLEDAGVVGHTAHAWIEEYIKSDNRACILPPEERAANCCLAAMDWMNSHNVRWIHTERKIYSRAYEYAGTLDGVATVDSCADVKCCPEPFKNRLSLIDWKSSNYLYTEFLLQTAAYQQAYQEETGEVIEDRWIIRLGKDDGEFEAWHLVPSTFGDDFWAFECCLELTRAIKNVTNRVKLVKDKIKQEQKQKAREERERQLKVKCKSANKYKGVRPPTCGCEYCNKLYLDSQNKN